MTLQESFRTVWFSRWLVLVAVVSAVAGGWLYQSKQEPVYVAEAIVQLVSTDTLTAAGVRLATDPSLVSSTAVAQAAATAVGDPSRAADIGANAVGESAASDPTKVQISVSSNNPAEAVALANATTTAYVAHLQSQFDSSVKAMQARLAALGTAIDQDQAAINANTATDGLLKAKYAATMDQYQALSSQLTEAQVVASPASIRQNAVGAQLASTPATLVYAIALLGGLLLGIGLAVVRRGLDTKVRTAGGARRSTGAPVLARLFGTAAAERSHERGGDLPVATRSATSFTQSVRELRTALQATIDPGAGAVIVVTAADVDAPRSFIAANLAASLALSGRTVIVLSGDLRQPRLNALLPAAVDVLQPPTQARQHRDVTIGASVPTATPHLSVHPALWTELDPADYLASDEVRDLIGRLRTEADVVIVDAPPMLVAADATILGAYADGVLLAATIGQTELVALEESADRLRAANARLLGIVLDGGGEGRRSPYAATYTFTGDALDAPSEPHQGADNERSTVLLDTP